ncbi:hypothetical protein EYF80_052038 [Liparis tanakae]|uniref:Uncharacterized protein n=1 Tax=Liparis tanakae TaxID=230148 RepID=A0A4Z2F9A3_9TELE|nr:hypothetical protein EYF80_052038 [Liparis tanakae]
MERCGSVCSGLQSTQFLYAAGATRPWFWCQLVKRFKPFALPTANQMQPCAGPFSSVSQSEASTPGGVKSFNL